MVSGSTEISTISASSADVTCFMEYYVEYCEILGYFYFEVGVRIQNCLCLLPRSLYYEILRNIRIRIL